MCLQNPLDPAVDLLPVGWTGLTGLESEGKQTPRIESHIPTSSWAEVKLCVERKKYYIRVAAKTIFIINESSCSHSECQDHRNTSIDNSEGSQHIS